MRSILLFVSILIASQLFAQQKGVEPVDANPVSVSTGVTYAVVVGISDYQNSNITDLRFAHRDAEAFAEYLRSPAGGSVPDKNLTLLVNEQSTAGNVIMALYGLIEQAKENDRVMIYFSGHGDVERKTISELGFLLCWDSPARVYMAGGTVSIYYLQEIITTLSVQNKAKVVVITDACHAGKLAGSAIGGPAITGGSLARQFANEVKIMSCQSDQLSLEGPQWGGGRGVFSYHLVDGLYGLADRNDDGIVTVSDMDRYLEDHVTLEADPQKQVPVLMGNKTEMLGKVDAELLATLKQRKAGAAPVLSAVDTKGVEAQFLAQADSNIQADYQAFLAALQKKQFFEPAETCAETLYARLSAAPELAALHGYLKRNYAAALQDEAQVAINDYLAADPRELRKRWTFDHRYDLFPQYLARAAELLGAQYYLYNNLKAREYYFAGLNLRLRGELEKDTLLFQEALKLQNQTLQLDSNAAYAYNELGLLSRRLHRYHSAIAYFEQAIVCSPNWVLPRANLCSIYIDDLEQPEQAIIYGKQALQIDSTYAMAHYNLGYTYQRLGDYSLAKFYYQVTTKYDPHYALAFFKIGVVYYHEKNYAAAEQAWLDYSRLVPNDADVYLNLTFAKVQQQQLNAALDYLDKALANGYRNLNDLNSDAELVELRKLPQYGVLIKKYFK